MTKNKKCMLGLINNQLASPKILTILIFCFLIAGTLEDYFFWVARQEMRSFLFGVMAQVIALAMALVSIFLFVRIIRNKELTWIKRVGYLFLIIFVFIFIHQASYWINDYLSFKGGGIAE